MISLSPFMIRSLGLFVPLVVVGLLWLWREPGLRLATAALLACAWTVPALLFLNLLAIEVGWWHFEAQGGVFMGLPVDLLLGWVLLWGALPILAFPHLQWPLMLALMLLLDVMFMPLMAPVLQLGQYWLVGELLALLFCLLPAQLLARWTMQDEQLTARVLLLGIGYSGLLFGVLPLIILDATGGSAEAFLERPLWLNSLGIQLLLLPAMLGLSGVQEFAQRGSGTPIPFDPPKQLVSSGIYAYLGNPMQLSACLMLIIWGMLLASAWVAVAGLMGWIFSIGLAAWSENEDLSERFGENWKKYRKDVPYWWPRWSPWYAELDESDDSTDARLYIGEGCLPCSQLAEWLQAREPSGLTLIAAEDHPSRDLFRLTYVSADGHHQEEGIAALARALEHIHLGWALIGFTIRLPVIFHLIQLLADAVGAEPRRIERRKT